MELRNQERERRKEETRTWSSKVAALVSSWGEEIDWSDRR